MIDLNVNPSGQVPWQQADASPIEPLNTMTAEMGTTANDAPAQTVAVGEQPTQALTSTEQLAQPFTPTEQPTRPFTPVNQPVPSTQALPPTIPAAVPASVPVAPNSPYPGMVPTDGSVPPAYDSISASVYLDSGAVPPQTPYSPYIRGDQPDSQPG